MLGCTSTIGGGPDDTQGGSGPGPGPGPGAGTTSTAGVGAAPPVTGSSGSGGVGSVNPGTGGTGSPASGGVPSSAGAPSVDCTGVTPGGSPLRRLTTYEYNNTVRDLLGDMTNPGRALPAQADSKHNLFGNDAEEQTASPLLIEKYQSVAEEIATRATADAAALGRLHACTRNLSASGEEACAREIATAFAPRAWRRQVAAAELDELVALYRTTRAIATTVTFSSAVAGMLEGILQSPEFLYRVEHGRADPSVAGARRVVGREMANRLSYLFWQTMPDGPLFQAADAGTLDSDAGVLAQARTMLGDERARATVGFFFDNLLPIPDLASLTRSAELFPTFSSAIGVAMREEVQRLLAFEIFQNSAPVEAYGAGSWPALLTAPYTFVNEALFQYYGASTFAPGTTVSGTEFKKVALNTDQRLGLLTLGGIMAGGTTSNLTNPVLRGTFLLNKMMCFNIELPAGLAVSPPDPYTGKTARERFSKHSSDGACRGCHGVIDPMGFPFENYDAVGRYREAERWTDPMTKMNYDTPIDASGSVPGVTGTAQNAVELVRLLATSENVQTCFSSHWMQFAYGRSVDPTADACTVQQVQSTFKGAGYNVKELLLALTQTDAFLYRTAE